MADESMIERNDEGQVTRVRSDRQVLEPESPEAVQVPEQAVDSNHLNESYKDSDDGLVAPLDQNVKLGDKTAELLDEASRTHQTAPLTGRTASDAAAAVAATGGQHSESATRIVQEETERRRSQSSDEDEQEPVSE